MGGVNYANCGQWLLKAQLLQKSVWQWKRSTRIPIKSTTTWKLSRWKHTCRPIRALSLCITLPSCFQQQWKHKTLPDSQWIGDINLCEYVYWLRDWFHNIRYILTCANLCFSLFVERCKLHSILPFRWFMMHLFCVFIFWCQLKVK